MDLQNIVLDFNNSKVFSLYQDDVYTITLVTNLVALKAALDSDSGQNITFSVVQYTVDQYGSGGVPRIVLNGGEFEPILLSAISSELNTQLTTTKSEVETDITNQLA